MMKAALAATMVCSVWGAETASGVQDWADKFCAASDALASQHAEMSPEAMQKLFEPFSYLMAGKIDCSEDPNNALLGFDLKGVSFQQCAAEKAKKAAHVQALQISQFKCLEVIADEAKGTGAIWIDFGNSGAHRSQFSVRGAFRFTLNKDHQCEAYHVVYDTYQYISTGVQEWAEEFCAASDALASQHADVSPEAMQKLFAPFSHLMADKIDCSEDPNNALLGFDLKGVSFQQCAAEKAKKAAHVQALQLSKFKCLEIVADEAKGTGAIWVDFGNSGAHRSQFSVRGAFRFTLKDDKCVAYHVVYDTFQYISTGVKEWAEEFCKTSEAVAAAGMDVSPEAMQKLFAPFSHLMADKIDCSEDPNNALLGFDLQGVSFQQCAAEKAKKAANVQALQLSKFKCLEIVADEAKGTGAIWIDFGNTGARRSQFSTRGAFRFTLKDDKCVAYHVVYDTYNYLGLNNMLAADSAAGSSMLGTFATFAAGVAFAVVVAGGIFAVSSKKPEDAYKLLA